MDKFKHAKFKRLEEVTCPHGEGKVTKVLLHSHQYWYQVDNNPNFYSEHEIKKVQSE